MSDRLRTVVVGLEHYHVTGWVETLGLFGDRIEVVGRYDPDHGRERLEQPLFVDPNLPERFPSWFQAAPFWSDLDALVRDARPELALVTLPNRVAPDAIERLAQAGSHVIVDKPGARNAAGAEQSVRVTRSAGVKLAVAFTRRYGQAWQRVTSDIAGGRLGRVLSVEAIFVTSSVPVRNPKNPIFDRDAMGGGVLHWLGIHDIDLVQWMTGQSIVSVQAMAATTSGADIDVEDTISMQFRLAGGAVGTLHVAYALPRPAGEGYVAVRGSLASVRIDATGATEWMGPATNANPLRVETTTSEIARLPGYGAAGALIVSDMLDAIAQQRDPLATGEDARNALRVVDAAYASAATGHTVSVEPDDRHVETTP